MDPAVIDRSQLQEIAGQPDGPQMTDHCRRTAHSPGPGASVGQRRVVGLPWVRSCCLSVRPGPGSAGLYSGG